ncbi:GumC family protein [Terricaulis sp.]|uniref:GumC family protein n=1 Tax=Terricaulis sp. TaxID=2768686 RepID=UPI003784D6C9
MSLVETNASVARYQGEQPLDYYPARSQFSALIQTVMRHWTWGFVAGGIFAALTFVAMMSAHKSYPATAVVMIQPLREQVLDVQGAMTGRTPDSALVESELEVMHSRLIAGAVVDELNLTADPEFNPTLDPGHPRTASYQVADDAGFRAAVNAGPAQVQTNPEREIVITELLNDVHVRRRGLTYAIEIGANTRSAEKSAAIANLFARHYLESQVENSINAAQRANSWLAARIAELRTELRVKEAAVEHFRAQHSLLTAAGATITETQVSGLERSSVEAATQLAASEARLQNVQSLIASGGSLETIATAIDSRTISDLRAQRAVAAREEADLASRLGDRHPALIAARQRVAEVDAQIQAEVTRIVASLSNEVQIARARLASIQSSASAAQGQLMGDNEEAVQLRELERDAAATRTLLESFLTRYAQTEQQGTLRIGDARLVSYATPARRPSSPRLSVSLLAALGVGGIIAAAAVFAREAMDDVFSSPDDLRRWLGLDTLASIPEVQEVDGRYASGLLVDQVVQEPHGRGAEAFRQLRANLLYQNAAGAQVVAVGSALANEGKTTTAIGLARISAMSGDRVVLVDCDIRAGDVQHRLDTTFKGGMLDLVNGKCTIDEVVMKDELSTADYIPLGAHSFEESDIFGTAEAAQVIEDLRQRYDLVILDMPPAVPVSEAQIIAQLADACFLVVRWRKTSREATRLAYAALEAASVPVMGAVLNRVDLKRAARYGCHDVAFKTSYAGFYAPSPAVNAP